MSPLGQCRPAARQTMSALPPKADIADRDRHVRFVLKADIIDPSLLFDPLVRTDRVELIEHRQDVPNVFGLWVRVIKGIEERAVFGT